MCRHCRDVLEIVGGEEGAKVRSEDDTRDPRAGEAIVSLGRKKGCFGPELEEIEGDRFDWVLTEPKVREKEVPTA